MSKIDIKMPSVAQARKKAVVSWAYKSAATMGVGVTAVAVSNNLLVGVSVLGAVFTARTMNSHQRIIKNIQNNKTQRGIGYWDL